MPESRRAFLQHTSLASLATFIGLSGGLSSVLMGCESPPKTRGRFGQGQGLWSQHQSPPRPLGESPYGGHVSPPNASPARPPRTGTVNVAGVDAIARQQWTTATPVAGKTNPMNGIKRVTVHHAGINPVTITDAAWSKNYVELIRNSHVNGRGWGDIGYHLIIDRAGRVYEGRPVSLQGAHVSKNNEHNLGILVVGNFEKQTPSRSQLAVLARTLSTINKTQRIGPRNFYTHREFNPTACPGRYLQPRIDSIRSRHLS